MRKPMTHPVYVLKTLPKVEYRSSNSDADANSIYEVQICTRIAPILTNKVLMFKLTIEEHFESDWPLIKAKFTSLELTKSAHFVCDIL